MLSVNLNSFRQKIRFYKKIFKIFLRRLEKNPPINLDAIAEEVDKEVWQEINCTSCANCCKKMTPTFTRKDIKRISAHLEMKPSKFKEKWLTIDKKDWVNINRPCQFLDLTTNMCTIYEVRPADCAAFPHLTKKKMVDYMHIHKQNIDYCPATYKMVEKMMARIKV